jgi:Ca2+-binding EF-hand superfamily protein
MKLSALSFQRSALQIAALCGVLLAAPTRADRPKMDEQYDAVFFSESRPVLMRLHVQIDGKPLGKVWNALIDDLFRKLDANKDGVLDGTELAGIPAPQDVFGSSQGLPARFQPPDATKSGTADANGDGKVTRDELAAFYRRHGGNPLSLVRTGDNGGGTNLQSSEAINKALMKLLDTNKDGKLSKEELSATPKRLLKLDLNDDEVVTIQELFGRPREGGNGQILLLGGGSAGTPLSADGPLLLVKANGGRDLAKSLLKHYGHSAGAKKSGKLSVRDLGIDAETFGTLDADRDGKLDQEELARFARRAPDLELDIKLGKDKAVTARPGKVKLAGVRIIREKGQVRLAVGNTTLNLGFDTGGGGSITFAQVDDNAFLKMQFSTADTDNNGYLDMKEARRSVFGGSFKATDADGDGKLYLKEVLAYTARRKELSAKARACCVTMALSDQGRGLFEMIDTDGDGRLSVREMRDAIKLVKKLDQNGDASLSLGEIPRRMLLAARMGPSGTVGGFGGVFIIQTTFQGTEPAVPEKKDGPVWFRKMDRNRDGDVSPREFLGTTEQFRAIDTDKDGLISLAEAKAFEAKAGKKY